MNCKLNVYTSLLSFRDLGQEIELVNRGKKRPTHRYASTSTVQPPTNKPSKKSPARKPTKQSPTKKPCRWYRFWRCLRSENEISKRELEAYERIVAQKGGSVSVENCWCNNILGLGSTEILTLKDSTKLPPRQSGHLSLYTSRVGTALGRDSWYAISRPRVEILKSPGSIQ